MTTVSVHAFVDESYRDERYLLVAAVVDPGEAHSLGRGPYTRRR